MTNTIAKGKDIISHAKLSWKFDCLGNLLSINLIEHNTWPKFIFGIDVWLFDAKLYQLFLFLPIAFSESTYAFIYAWGKDQQDSNC